MVSTLGLGRLLNQVKKLPYWQRAGYDSKEEFSAHRKRYRRKHMLTTGGRHFRVLKRDYPEDDCCELCGRKTIKIDYHHWDETNLGIGMWLCYRCHIFAHGVEDGYLIKYMELKEEIENELAKAMLL